MFFLKKSLLIISGSITLLFPVFVNISNAHAQTTNRIVGNDYFSANSNINESAFRKDNMYNPDNNSVFLPNPQGNINLNLLGNQTNINLTNLTDDQKKRQRYFATQKRKKAIRKLHTSLENEKKEHLAAIKAQQKNEALKNELSQKQAKLQSLEEQKIKNQQMNANANTYNQQQQPYSMPTFTSNGFAPNSAPLGLPNQQ